nr:Chain C, GLY-ARG-LEU-ASN-GLU-PRO-ILE-LYS-VAL [synthetic construct]6Y29_C Chain C, mE [synthetic construct]
GRLNEPIKV